MLSSTLAMASVVELNLANVNDQYYTAPMYIGSVARQSVNLVVDTSTQWTWVSSISCPQCNQVFNSSMSKTYLAEQYNIQNVNYNGGQSSVQGVESFDLFAFNSTAKQYNTSFLLVSQTVNMTAVDGYLGLAPTFSSKNLAFKNTTSQLFVTGLENSNLTKFQMFSLALSQMGGTSKLHLGGYNNSYVYSYSGINNQNASNLISWVFCLNSSWTLSLTGATVFNMTPFTPSTSLAFINSSQPLTYLPASDYNQLYPKLVNDSSITCVVDPFTNLLYCSCTGVNDPRFLNITIGIGTYNLQLSYLKWDPNKQKCYLTIVQDTTGSNAWRLGIPFLTAYYAIFDIDNSRIGFVGNIQNSTFLSSGGSQSLTDYISPISNYSFIASLAAAGVALIAVIIAVVLGIYLYRKYKKAKLAPQTENTAEPGNNQDVKKPDDPNKFKILVTDKDDATNVTQQSMLPSKSPTQTPIPPQTPPLATQNNNQQYYHDYGVPIPPREGRIMPRQYDQIFGNEGSNFQTR